MNGSAYGRAESPIASLSRGFGSDFLGLQNLQTRRASGRSMNTDSPSVDRLVSRRSSAQPPIRSSRPGTPHRQDSAQSLFSSGEHSEPQEMPIIQTLEPDDYFDNDGTPVSPLRALNDMISVSTVAAGPSVQVLERMSVAVRKLESEKVTTKEEITRLAAQRDEARNEIVSLMQEMQVHRKADVRVKELEEEVEKLNARYQTTLEMLGEKSELVEELRADVQDIKGMYRELVQQTTK